MTGYTFLWLIYTNITISYIAWIGPILWSYGVATAPTLFQTKL